MSRTRRHGRERHRRAPPGLPFALSDHAIDRLRERMMPALSLPRVRIEAKILARSAQRTEARTPAGQEVWVATDGEPVRFIVKRDGDGRRTCVTVLAPAKVGETEMVGGDETGEEVA